MTAPRFLENVRVVDLSQYIPGPLATRQLADLGADVIKIEPPGGDPMRSFMRGENESVSPVYRHVNRGKRIAFLDLKSKDGKAKFSELLAEADVLLESYRPGVLDRLGFARETLTSLKPELIHCALSGYGQVGPYRERAGHDINYCAGSSITAMNGTAAQPMIGFPPLADHAAAMQASIAILAALVDRDRRGGFIDISLFETSLSWQYLPVLTGSDQRMANILNGGAACYNLYRSSDDRFVSLGAIETHFWENFCQALKHPEWIERQFESMPQQKLIEAVARVISDKPLTHWNDLLNDVDCCYEAVYLPAELHQHPQIGARDALTGFGPAWPGWIDGQPVAVASDFTEIDQLTWRAVTCE